MGKENINILTQYADAMARVKYLRTAINKLEDKLCKLKTTDYGLVSDVVTKGKKGGKPLGTVKITGFRVEEYRRTVENLEERKLLLKHREEELLELMNQAEEFIEGIEDIELRNICSLYYIENMTWVQVAHQMNELYRKKCYTENSCRHKHDRYIKKSEDKAVFNFF